MCGILGVVFLSLSEKMETLVTSAYLQLAPDLRKHAYGIQYSTRVAEDYHIFTDPSRLYKL